VFPDSAVPLALVAFPTTGAGGYCTHSVSDCLVYVLRIGIAEEKAVEVECHNLVDRNREEEAVLVRRERQKRCLGSMGEVFF
jgi:hypothetical protein